ncbi:glycosyltransferase involved in cell wall biosynthesis [Lactobacillus colini]|uniref:4,4'-diaponeurosporenoate glycosyltransferase n=1 Tax=Lactobacillus colini TaxID=1819254 RepID=A0ABS4MFG3_9LACO|nr:glycosyltransferase family 2 protein [Lactobacillus colini]MBP2058425.1 glycosyltransferase involved in cell wall biosynthesis [Lactobacillus colini]
MVTKRRNLNFLLIWLSIAPIYLQFVNLFWGESSLNFSLNTFYALVLVLALTTSNIEDIDQWFLEKATTWLSVNLWLLNLIDLSGWLSIKTPELIYQLGILTTSASLYFLERHFTLKNILLIAINLNCLAYVFPPAGAWGLLITSLIMLSLYLERFAITFSEQFRLSLLIVYLTVTLCAITWVTLEWPLFLFDNVAWQIEALALPVILVLAWLACKMQERIIATIHLFFAIGYFTLISEMVIFIGQPRSLNIAFLAFCLVIYINLFNIFGSVYLDSSHRKISVIIPTHNDEKTIVKALQSIRIQSYQDWEVVVVDDGSSDKTLTYLRRYLKYNSMPVKCFSVKHHGRLNAVRYGLKYISGDICHILDPKDALYDHNVFYRAMTNLCGEKCDGIFVGIQQENRLGRIHEILRPPAYYDSWATVVKLALTGGKDIFVPYIYWRRDIFETTVKKNYLINNLPAWYNVNNNLGLRMANANFVGLKCGIKTRLDLEPNLVNLSGQLRTLHHVLANFKINSFNSQARIYQFLRQMHLSSMGIIFFKMGRTKLKNITPKLIAKSNQSHPYLTAIAKFAQNYDPEKAITISLPAKLKLYDGSDMEDFEKDFDKNRLDTFYLDFMQYLKQGPGIMQVAPSQKKRLARILEFFTIKDYITIEEKR